LIITGGVLTDCPLLALAPTEVEIINSTCQMDCSVSGGQILAPVTNPCPIGSTLQYRIDQEEWTTTLPNYAQSGPSQRITTRCRCDVMHSVVSPASSGVFTLPGMCERIVNSANSGPGSLRHAVGCAQNDDVLVYDLPSVSQTFLTEPLALDKSVIIMGMLEMGVPTINIDFLNISGSGLNITGPQVVLENIKLASQNNVSNHPLLHIHNGSELVTKGQFEIVD
jgi:hypothetical protein